MGALLCGSAPIPVLSIVAHCDVSLNSRVIVHEYVFHISCTTGATVAMRCGWSVTWDSKTR